MQFAGDSRRPSELILLSAYHGTGKRPWSTWRRSGADACESGLPLIVRTSGYCIAQRPPSGSHTTVRPPPSFLYQLNL